VSSGARMTFRLRAALPGLLAVLALIALARFRPPDGHEHAALAQFFGRFHPTLVHLPIAFLLLVVLLEVAGGIRRWSRVGEAAGFVLALATLSAFVAATLGWLLAWSGGYNGPQVTLHLWSGVWLCLACVLCCSVRRRPPASPGATYALALAATVALMVWTSHLGGQLTHGENYLTEYLPARARAWIGLAPLPAKARVRPASGSPRATDSFYAAAVAPIFENHCVTCHDANKQKGKLRLDTYEWIMRGGEDGAVIKPGDPKGSDLYQRINLPPDDDDFMPSDGKPALKADDIRMIEHWIATGASATAPVGDFVLPAAEPPPPPVAPDFRPLTGRIESLEAALGVHLVPRSQVPTDGLILRTVSSPARCDDAALVRLEPVADLIVDAELARTKVTDAGLKTLARFHNLRSLDLSHTAITSANLGLLASLPHLERLNLTGTAVDAAGLAKLRPALHLKHLYYFGTPAAH